MLRRTATTGEVAPVTTVTLEIGRRREMNGIAEDALREKQRKPS